MGSPKSVHKTRMEGELLVFSSFRSEAEFYMYSYSNWLDAQLYAIDIILRNPADTEL